MTLLEPLSNKLRPQSVKDFIGQRHLLDDDRVIGRMIRSHTLSSMILYGPPGTGKTSLAYALAGTYHLPLVFLNASNIKKSDITNVLNKEDQTTLLFIDEIHRLTKPNQDLLLPGTESGQIILMGATTENPYREINEALRSRVQLFEMKHLSDEEVQEGIQRAVDYLEEELGQPIDLSKDALQHLIRTSGGDLRSVINSTELAVKSNQTDSDQAIHVDLATVQEVTGKKGVAYNKQGESYYDLLSAFQKSIRGSDVDASLYYLGVLLEAGDLEAIFRRLGVIAYEDVGFGNLNAVSRTIEAIEYSRHIGLPECRIPLAFSVIDLALSPKSNVAYQSIDKVMKGLRRGMVGAVPNHLKENYYGGGKKYLYPHDYPGHVVEQDYLPDNLKNKQFFTLDDPVSRYEQFLVDRYDELK